MSPETPTEALAGLSEAQQELVREPKAPPSLLATLGAAAITRACRAAHPVVRDEDIVLRETDDETVLLRGPAREDQIVAVDRERSGLHVKGPETERQRRSKDRREKEFAVHATSMT